MIIRVLLSKRNDEPIEIVPVVKQCVKVVYIKAITKRLTTSEATELGVLRVSQLVLLVATKIV